MASLDDIRQEIERNRGNAEFLGKYLAGIVGAQNAYAFREAFMSQQAGDFDDAWRALENYVKKNPLRYAKTVGPIAAQQYGAAMVHNAQPVDGGFVDIRSSAERSADNQFLGELVREGIEKGAQALQANVVANARDEERLAASQQLANAADPQLERNTELTSELLELQIKNEQDRSRNLELESTELKKEKIIPNAPKFNLSPVEPASPLKAAAGRIAAGAVDVVKNKAMNKAGAIAKEASSMTGLGLFIAIALEILDFAIGMFPGLGDTAALFVAGGVLSLYALIRGQWLWIFLVWPILAADWVIGLIPFAGDAVDAVIVANVFCVHMIDKSYLTEKARKAGEEAPTEKLLESDEGTPTWFAEFIFIIPIAYAFYGLWNGNPYAVLAPLLGILLLAFANPAFREEML